MNSSSRSLSCSVSILGSLFLLSWSIVEIVLDILVRVSLLAVSGCAKKRFWFVKDCRGVTLPKFMRNDDKG